MKIEEFIELLRGNKYFNKWTRSKEISPHEDNAVEGIGNLTEFIFRRGECWRFALIIKAMYPEIKAHQCWHTKENWGHIVVEHNGEFYDITGKLNRDDWYIDTEDMSEEQLRNYVPITFNTVYNFIKEKSDQ